MNHNKYLKWVAPAGLCILIGLHACRNSTNGSTKNGDTTQGSSETVTHVPDNSDATNPSLADTAYQKKDTISKAADTPGARK